MTENLIFIGSSFIHKKNGARTPIAVRLVRHKHLNRHGTKIS
jgi:hypothetical protein